MDYTVKVTFDDGSSEEKIVQEKKRDKETVRSIVKEFEDKCPNMELVSMEVVER